MCQQITVTIRVAQCSPEWHWSPTEWHGIYYLNDRMQMFNPRQHRFYLLPLTKTLLLWVNLICFWKHSLLLYQTIAKSNDIDRQICLCIFVFTSIMADQVDLHSMNILGHPNRIDYVTNWSAIVLELQHRPSVHYITGQTSIQIININSVSITCERLICLPK